MCEYDRNGYCPKKAYDKKRHYEITITVRDMHSGTAFVESICHKMQLTKEEANEFYLKAVKELKAQDMCPF